MMLPSHASDGTAGVPWPQRDVNTESCWQQYCRVMLAMTLQLKVVLVVVRLRNPLSLEHQGDVAL
jgi:hypothetical protein